MAQFKHNLDRMVRGLSPGQDRCLEFLHKTPYSQCLSPHRCINMDSSKFNTGGNPVMD